MGVAPVVDEDEDEDDELEDGEQDVGGGAVFDDLIGEVKVGERKVVRMTERN